MGLGMWQWNAMWQDSVWWRTTVDDLVGMGIKEWLLKILDGTNQYNGDLLKPAVDYAKSKGIFVWVWGYEYPSLDDAKALANRASALEANGIVIDAEKEWATPNVIPAEFVQTIRMNYPGKIALSTYSAPSLHPEFPFLSFMKECDIGMPQVYQTPQDVWSVRAQKEWLEFNKPVILTGLADQYMGSTKDMLTFLQWCVFAEQRANLWCYDHLTNGMKSVIKEYAEEIP